MKKILSICLILMLVNTNVMAGEVYDNIYENAEIKHEGVREISYSQFLELRDSGEPYVLLDVLMLGSYSRGHIPGAENFPVPEIIVENAEKRLNKNASIVVYCGSSHCMASVMAAKKLGELGYKNIVDFKGGLQEWQEKGNKLVK